MSCWYRELLSHSYYHAMQLLIPLVDNVRDTLFYKGASLLTCVESSTTTTTVENTNSLVGTVSTSLVLGQISLLRTLAHSSTIRLQS